MISPLANDATASIIGTMDDAAGKCSGLAVAGTKLTEGAVPPQWIELIPAGDFKGRDGRGPFRMSNAQEVIAATRALRMDAGLPIDYDHATDFGAPEGRPAPAAGWICGLENRAGALWGKVDWTAHGAGAVATREYRYISPVFEYAADGEVTRLLRAALTNNPNLYLTAISARDAKSYDAAKHATPRGRDPEHMEIFDEELRNVLGLPADASIQAVIAVIRALVLKQGDTPAASDARGAADAPACNAHAEPAHFVSTAQFEEVLTELNRERVARSQEHADHLVGAAVRDGRLSPSQRDWAIAYCRADAAGFAKFIANQSPLLTIADRAGSAYSHSRHAAVLAGLATRAADRLSAAEIAICSKLGIKPAEYVARKAGAGEFLPLN